MSISGTKTRVHPLDNQAGGILLVALAILLVAGTVSAGVAHLVSLSSGSSVNNLQSEQAFYIAESAARMTDCPTGEQSLGQGYFTCDADQCDDGQKLIRAGIGGSNLDASTAYHQLCAPDPNMEFDPDDCTDPGEVDDWSSPPECVASGAGGGSGVIPPGQIKKTGQIAVHGDVVFQSTGTTLDFSDAQVCITGEISAESGKSGKKDSLTIEFNDDGKSCYCSKHSDITIVNEASVDQCCDPSEASCSVFQPSAAWNYNS